jgi:hypothetical protein
LKNISVIIHGPVHTSASRNMEAGIIEKSIASVREHLPGARIILSTWPDQFTDALDIDELVISEDPGANIIAYDFDGSPLKENNNRQIVAVSAGLKQVKTPYAIKLRSDNYLLHSGFIGWQKAYPKRTDILALFKERVVVSHRLTKRFSDGYPIVRHLCDFFAYGLTEDLLKMWDVALLDNFPFDPSKFGQGQHMSAPNRIVSAEQHFASRWITKLNPDSAYLKGHFDYSDELNREWEHVVANNLVVVEANNLGLKTIDRLKSNKYRANEMSHAEWQMLYQKFCDPELYAANWQLKLDKTWYRAFKAPFNKLKLKMKFKKNALGL